MSTGGGANAGGGDTSMGPQYGSTKPPKYDEEGGFDLYKAMLESFLTQRGCWGIVDGTDVLGANATAAETARRAEKNALARDALLRGVLIKDAAKICTMTDARQMWLAFELEKTKRNYSNSLFVRKKFYSYEYKAGMDLDKYLDDMEAMRRQLRNMNETISDNEMVKVVLQGVAHEYRGIVRMFDKEVRDGNAPQLSDVLNTIRSEAELDKQKTTSTKKTAKSSDSAKILQIQQQQFRGNSGKRKWKPRPSNRKRFKGNDGQYVEMRTCHSCHKTGHLKRNCHEYLAKQQKSEENSVSGKNSNKKKLSSMSLVRWSGAGREDTPSIHMVVSGDIAARCDEWMIDTGAGVHVCTDWTAFSSMREDSMTFVGWKGDASSSEAVGQVKIVATNAISGGEVILELEDTRYTSTGRTNLLSLELLERCGWIPSYSEVTRPEDRAMYLDHGDVRLVLPKRNGHYWLTTRRDASDMNLCSIQMSRRQSSLLRWHMKFAHLNAQALKKLVMQEMADDIQSLKLDDFKEPLDCIACTAAKQRRMSYKRHNKRSKTCFDRIMSDVCSIGVKTTGGSKYFQLIEDEASRYKWCFLLKHKDEATVNVINWIRRYEKEHTINKFWSDGGGEFINNKLEAFLDEHLIEYKNTDLYTPEENSLVEKLNSHLMNKVRAVREAAGLPMSLWGEILMYVVEVDNMSPTKALAGMTPYQKLTGIKPDVSSLHVCGCVAFVHVPKKKRANKLSPKAVPTLFLGYAERSLGYRLLDLRTGDLIERRDVSFSEDITVDGQYVRSLLARRYHGERSALPDNIPFVRLPVNAVLDSVHIPDHLSDGEDSSEDAFPVSSDTAVKKRRRADSDDSGSDNSGDVPFSGGLNDEVVGGADAEANGSGVSSSASSGDESIDNNSGANFSPDSPDESESNSGRTLSPSSSPPATTSDRTGTAPAHPTRTTTSVQPTWRSTRQRRPNSRYDPSTYVMTCSLMQCMLIGIVNELLNPTTVRQVLASEHATQWRDAMNVEYNSLMKNTTWELVPRPKSSKGKRVNILTSLWVLVVKRNEKGVIERFKARLAIRGFLQKYGIDHLATYSPVVRIESVRLVMILALMLGLDCRHVDFVTAFLNGELVDVDIYMEQPEGYHDGTDRVCRLLKGLYGLKQASRIWNDTLHAYLVAIKFQQCTFDSGVYYRNGSQRAIFLTVYVDDIVLAAKPHDIEIVVRELSIKFELKDTCLVWKSILNQA